VLEASSFETADVIWKEVVDCKGEFQNILRMLILFDEQSGRYREYGEPELHYMRKAISIADPDLLRIYLRDLGAYVYYVVVELSIGGGRLATAYVHEDGIRLEREQRTDESGHPVHGIVCLSDLFEADARVARVLPANLYEIGPGLPGDMALELMIDDSLFVD
jgi:hypothetical protein